IGVGTKVVATLVASAGRLDLLVALDIETGLYGVPAQDLADVIRERPDGIEVFVRARRRGIARVAHGVAGRRTKLELRHQVLISVGGRRARRILGGERE